MVADPREPRHSRSARRLNEPRPVLVAAEGGTPLTVERIRVASVRDEWRLSDRWWTDEPVRRRYFEVVLETGRNVVVYRDEASGRWFRQQA